MEILRIHSKCDMLFVYWDIFTQFQYYCCCFFYSSVQLVCYELYEEKDITTVIITVIILIYNSQCLTIFYFNAWIYRIDAIRVYKFSFLHTFFLLLFLHEITHHLFLFIFDMVITFGSYTQCHTLSSVFCFFLMVFNTINLTLLSLARYSHKNCLITYKSILCNTVYRLPHIICVGFNYSNSCICTFYYDFLFINAFHMHKIVNFFSRFVWNFKIENICWTMIICNLFWSKECAHDLNYTNLAIAWLFWLENCIK